MPPQPEGALMIMQERIEQIEHHGYAPGDDLAYDQAELALAAKSYLDTAIDMALRPETVRQPGEYPLESWPWPSASWREPTDRIKALVKAGALIAAEIDREQFSRNLLATIEANPSALAWMDAGVCRVCGCTDSLACTEDRQGNPIEPCHWIEPDLCSACATADLAAAMDVPPGVMNTIHTIWPHSETNRLIRRCGTCNEEVQTDILLGSGVPVPPCPKCHPERPA